jgi:adenylate kinase
MDQGELVPDSVTNAMMTSRLQEPDTADGFLLDGYPRNTEQAGELARFLSDQQQPLDAVVRLAVDDEQVLARLLERARVQGRTDDTEDVIRHRLEVYRASTEPLVDYYCERQLLRDVDGFGSVDDVTARILAVLSAE